MRESVGQVIRRALSDARFRPGQALSEAALAAEMGISRGPVRESLLILVQEGLLTHSPNRGFSVVNLTKEDLRETNEVRLPLEATALKLAQNHVTAKEFKELKSLKRKLVSGYSSGEFNTCSRADMEFHSLIWDRTGNARLAAVLRNLLAPFFAYGSFFKAPRPELTPKLLDAEHQMFIDFLNGSGELSAEECVRFHLGPSYPASEEGLI